MRRRDLLFGAAALALKEGKLDEALRLIDGQTQSGSVAAASLWVAHKSNVVQRAFGKARDSGAVFLLASITKPMTVTALMTLVDRKQVSLTDPVQRHVPEFRGGGRERVLVRHLLNHTSGLPDMLPENVELRTRHAPLADFVAGTCRTPLLFTPGSEVRYQSMGTLLASEIVARTTRQPFPQFLRDQIFQPLGMKDTSLGLGGRALAQTMQCQVPEHNDWDWNSSYWRNLGAPWGGALATAGDVARFLSYFSNPDSRVLKPETAALMIAEQTPGLKQRWGLGWLLDSKRFGNGCSEATYGHSGSTGTLCWLDPKKHLSFVLLTTKPADQSNQALLNPVSEIVSQTTGAA